MITLLASRLASFSRSLKRRAVYRKLITLDAHLLTDIGLTRADVEGMRRIW